MAGGRRPKDKGNAFERLCVNRFKSAGFKAKRSYLSDGRSLGHHESVDMIATIYGKLYKFQCKIRKKFSKNVIPDTNHVNAQLIKQDYGQTFIIMPLQDYIADVKRFREMGLHEAGYKLGVGLKVEKELLSEEENGE